MTILSIQSHVVCGHVGNRSAVFPLERMGYEVWPVNTVQFSSHSGLPGWRGTAFGGDHLLDLVRGLESSGVLGACDAVLSGYMGDVDTGKAILAAVDAVRKANPRALYLCDPVMGDIPEGVYVQQGLPDFMRAEAVPRADIILPNVFEARFLAAGSFRNTTEPFDAAEILASLHGLGPDTVIVSSHLSADGQNIGFLASDRSETWSMLTPRIPFDRPPKGSGDLASALFLGNYLATMNLGTALERMANSLHGVLSATYSSGSTNLAIIGAQEVIAVPGNVYRAEKMM